MDDRLKSLQQLRLRLVEEEKAGMQSLRIGDIVYVPLDESDGMTLKKGYSDRRKYIVIVGFTPEGIAVGALLINSNIDLSKRNKELLDCQYPLLRRNYPHVLNYDSWLDCSEIFELSSGKIIRNRGLVKGSLMDEDVERVMKFLKETDVIDNFTKRRFGIIL